MDDSRIYHAIPKWLENITANRDWELELRTLSKFLPTDKAIWEWGCRTGVMGQRLKQVHHWQGGEDDEGYFVLAQQKHGDSVFKHPFPAEPVCCLFSWFSPLFAVEPEALQSTLKNVLDSIESGGWAILEGGSNPTHARSRYSMMDVYDGETEKLVRAAVPILEQNIITFEYTWMYGADGMEQIEEQTEVQRYYLHTDAQIQELVHSLGGHIRLVEQDGIRLWLIAHQANVIDRLVATL